MSIRRPPTALGLTASDVAELTHKLHEDRQARAQASRSGTSSSKSQDELLRREHEAREAKDALGVADRVGV